MMEDELERVNVARRRKNQRELTHQQATRIAEDNSVFGSQLLDFLIAYEAGIPIFSAGGFMGYMMHDGGMHPSPDYSPADSAPASNPDQSSAQDGPPVDDSSSSGSSSSDDLEIYLSDNGFINKISKVSQNVGNKASDLVLNAMGFLGVPYRRGGSDDNGFDCSGFVRSMYEQTLG